MRYLVASLVLVFSGCLAVQEPHNPTAKPEGVASVASASAAPVDSAPAPEPEPALPRPSKVELMKSMFLAHLDLKAEVLKMAETLSEEELAELNEFLSDYGVQIQRVKKRKPQSEAF